MKKALLLLLVLLSWCIFFKNHYHYCSPLSSPRINLPSFSSAPVPTHERTHVIKPEIAAREQPQQPPHGGEGQQDDMDNALFSASSPSIREFTQRMMPLQFHPNRLSMSVDDDRLYDSEEDDDHRAHGIGEMEEWKGGKEQRMAFSSPSTVPLERQSYKTGSANKIEKSVRCASGGGSTSIDDEDNDDDGDRDGVDDGTQDQEENMMENMEDLMRMRGGRARASTTVDGRVPSLLEKLKDGRE